jgi:hypothetical protein
VAGGRRGYVLYVIKCHMCYLYMQQCHTKRWLARWLYAAHIPTRPWRYLPCSLSRRPHSRLPLART